MPTKRQSWDKLHERFEVKGIKHQETYGLDGACSDMAEDDISRRLGAEIGIHPHIAGSYAEESSRREDRRKVSNGDQVSALPRWRFSALREGARASLEAASALVVRRGSSACPWLTLSSMKSVTSVRASPRL
jgi:hypothetical protein